MSDAAALTAVLKGVEIALARDEDLKGALKLITEHRDVQIPTNTQSPSPDTLDTYAKIFMMKKRIYDPDLKRWDFQKPSSIDVAAATALKHYAAHIRQGEESGKGVDSDPFEC